MKFSYFLYVNSLLKAICNGTKEEAPTIAASAIQWLRDINACGDAGMLGFARKRHTPYVHIIGIHAPEWNRQLGPLRKFGGEKLENLNDQFKRGHLRQTAGKDFLASIGIQKRHEMARRNQSVRGYLKNAERVPKQGCQGPYRGYLAKEQAKERREAAEAATAGATALYVNPLSTLTVPELLAQYKEVSGQRKF